MTTLTVPDTHPQQTDPDSGRQLPYSPNGWYTVAQLAQRNPWTTESAIRAQIFRADELGLTDAIMRPAGQRKVVVHEPTWLDRQRAQQGRRR